MNGRRIIITLVGSNPLPVYVSILTAKIFGDEYNELKFDEVVFVVSETTIDYAIRIKDKLQIESYRTCNLKDNQRNSREILNITKGCLTDIEDISSIHLNYTGGTKTMAINVYKAIDEFIKGADKQENSGKIDFILTDLDPEKHRLTLCCKGGNYTSIPCNGTLRDSIICTLEDVIELHGFEKEERGIDSKNDEEYLGMNTPILYKQFIELLCNKKKAMYGFHDMYDKLRGKESKRWIEKPKDYIKVGDSEFCVKDYDGFKSLMKIPEQLTELKNYSYEFSSIKDFCGFIDGKWLERFVYDEIQILIENKDVSVNDIRMNFKVDLGDKRDTELDIIVIKGYQLFLVSCTTDSNIGRVKQKAFEAIYRAKQLGGEQAITILISWLRNTPLNNDCKSNIECLKEDLKAFELDNNVHLLGREEINNSIISSPTGETIQSRFKTILK